MNSRLKQQAQAKEILQWNSALNLHTDKQGRPFIWLFYHTTKLPAVLALSLSTIKCHHANTNIRVQLVTDFYDWLHKADVHPNFNALSHVHKADYFRAHILCI